MILNEPRLITCSNHFLLKLFYFRQDIKIIRANPQYALTRTHYVRFIVGITYTMSVFMAKTCGIPHTSNVRVLLSLLPLLILTTDRGDGASSPPTTFTTAGFELVLKAPGYTIDRLSPSTTAYSYSATGTNGTTSTNNTFGAAKSPLPSSYSKFDYACSATVPADRTAPGNHLLGDFAFRIRKTGGGVLPPPPPPPVPPPGIVKIVNDVTSLNCIQRLAFTSFPVSHTNV